MKNYKEYLAEIKLSRVFNHFQAEEYPVGIITAFRNDPPPYEGKSKLETNIINNKNLARAIKDAGYGYVWVDGGWKEEDEATGEKIEVEEDSILVVGNENDNGKLYKLLLDKTKEYNQDGFMFKPEGTTEIFIVDKQGNKDKIADAEGGFKLDKFEYGYTTLRGGGAGRTFSFHEAYRELNWIGKRQRYERLKKGEVE